MWRFKVKKKTKRKIKAALITAGMFGGSFAFGYGITHDLMYAKILAWLFMLVPAYGIYVVIDAMLDDDCGHTSYGGPG